MTAASGHGVASRDAHPPADRYARIRELLAADRPVILDGATGTELIEVTGQRPEAEEHLWGVTAVVDAPADVQAVHRRYVEVGCDVISTNTWGLPTAVRNGAPSIWRPSRPVHWIDVARDGVRLARAAAEEAGRGSDVAVAFSVNGDVDSADGDEVVKMLTRAFEDAPPDLILLETLSLVRDSTYRAVEDLMAIGLPVWLSFRRCRHGVCGVYGEHWGGPEGDAFGRAARRFETIGVGALLINCIPPDHVPGILPWLRDFTDLPLGIYPNLGYLSSAGWRHEPDLDGRDYAELALQWREEGAQIVGGCCGVGPDHLAAARAALEGTRPGTRRPGAIDVDAHDADGVGPHWSDERGRGLFPLDFPDIWVDPGVESPTNDSLLLWKHIYQRGIGADKRCLDVGCGAGLLAVQLGRNGAAHVHAIDIDAAAAKNTLSNAFRNGVAERVTTAAVDLYPWVPEERYELIVACLSQTPIDPFEQVMTHRAVDYWGRNLLDHLIQVLPEALADDGVAYVTQLSVIGEQRTIEELDRAGLEARVIDYGFSGFDESQRDKREQIERVEQLSDAYHLAPDGGDGIVVAYLLEIVRSSGGAS